MSARDRLATAELEYSMRNWSRSYPRPAALLGADPQFFMCVAARERADAILASIAAGDDDGRVPVAQLWSYEELLELLDEKERRLNNVHALIAAPTFTVGRLVSVDALVEAVTR